MSEEEITPSGQVTLCPLYHRDHSDNTEHSLGQTYRVFLAALHHLQHLPSTGELYWVSIGNSRGKFLKIFIKKRQILILGQIGK